MGREVRRVPLDFNWPIGKVWEGFLLPEKYEENPCPDCEQGWSREAQHLYDLWHGLAPFNPEDTGSTPWRSTHPSLLAFAERNVAFAPEFYGNGPYAVSREAQRQADLRNRRWAHHLTQDDVDALADANRLPEFTSTWSRERGWQPKHPPVRPTCAEVNEWSLIGLGHDAVNAYVVIEARCKREEHPFKCSTCEGHASLEVYPGQRAESDEWIALDPAEGEGWQLWETVTEGSPVSPVFSTARKLAEWMSSPHRGRQQVSMDAAMKFVEVGWAPTAVSTPKGGVMSGVEWVGLEGTDGN